MGLFHSRRRDTSTGGSTLGPSVDAKGNPVIDPTKNVLDLVDEATRRQDDLRNTLEQTLWSEHVTLKEHVIELLHAHNTRYEQRHAALQKSLHDAIVAQKEAVKEAFTRQKEMTDAAMASAALAVSKAELANERRFDAVNEFRAQLGDQQRTLMPRIESEARLNALADKIGVLEGFRTEMLSRGTGAKEGWAWAVAVAGVVLTLLSIASVVTLLLRTSP